MQGSNLRPSRVKGGMVHTHFRSQRQIANAVQNGGLRTRKTYDGPLVIGEDSMSFAISHTVEGQDASGTPITPLRAN
jgi:hypothetical protein